MTLAVVVEADGGARGNPGSAGYGAVVRDAATGAVLAERAEGLGSTTNNVAEYAGLIAGLRAAAELGATDVEVRMDSKLVVEQMTGRWRVRQPHLQPLAAEAATLVRQLGRVRFSWIPRASNSHADRLANQAMDAQDGKTQHGKNWPASPVNPPVDPLPANRLSDSAVAARSPASWSGATGIPTRLLLLRHAQSEHTAARRYSGRGDVPLTPLGERQAAALARRLVKPDLSTVDGVAAVVTSPLRRCYHTAELVADTLAAPLVVHDQLAEVDFGAWEGLTFAEAAASHPELHPRWLADSSIAAPGGESFDAVYGRVRRALDELIATYGPATLVLVSHVTPIKTLLRMALNAGPSLYYRLHLDPGSLSIAEFHPDGTAVVRLVNDTAHLP